MSEDANRHEAALLAGRVTQWELYGLDQIWEMVRDENGRINWVQDGAWQRMAELCAEQADQLELALKQLTDRWPARPGTASFAFKLQIDRLVSSMRESVRAAISNQEAIRRITYVLSVAQAEIGALLDERQRYVNAEQQMIEYTRAISSFYQPADGSAAPPPEPPRPPMNWQADLDNRARQLIAQADTVVGAEMTRIQIPTQYALGVADDGGQNIVVGSTFGTGQSVPMPSSVPHPIFDPPHARLLSPKYPDNLHDDRPILSEAPTKNFTNPDANAGRATDLIVAREIERAFSTTSGPRPSPNMVSARSTNNTVPSRMANVSAGNGNGRLGTISGMPMAPMTPPLGRMDSAASNVVPGGVPMLNGRRRRGSVDPADPWSVPIGGGPVLEPCTETSFHDPGTGVIGLDR